MNHHPPGPGSGGLDLLEDLRDPKRARTGPAAGSASAGGARTPPTGGRADTADRTDIADRTGTPEETGTARTAATAGGVPSAPAAVAPAPTGAPVVITRITPLGLGLAGAVVVLAAGAAVLRYPELVALAAAAGCALAAAALSVTRRPRLRATLRVAPSGVARGEPATLAVEIHNPSRRSSPPVRLDIPWHPGPRRPSPAAAASWGSAAQATVAARSRPVRAPLPAPATARAPASPAAWRVGWAVARPPTRSEESSSTSAGYLQAQPGHSASSSTRGGAASSRSGRCSCAARTRSGWSAPRSGCPPPTCCGSGRGPARSARRRPHPRATRTAGPPTAPPVA